MKTYRERAISEVPETSLEKADRYYNQPQRSGSINAGENSELEEKPPEFAAFDNRCRALARYREAVIGPSPKASELVTHFIRACGSSRTYHHFHPVLNHLLRYMRNNGMALNGLNQEIRNKFQDHRSVSVGFLTAASTKAAERRALSKFTIFLQYKDIAESYNWQPNDPEIANSFYRKVVEDGLGPRRGNYHARTALHFLIWLRLAGISQNSINETVIAQFTEHECDCGMYANTGLPTSYAKAGRKTVLARFLRFLSGQDVVVSNGAVVTDREKSVFPPIVRRYCRWLIEYKGLKERTVHQYALDVVRWLPVLGLDAGTYSAASIRNLAAAQLARLSPAMQSRFIKSVRTYIKFCVFEKRCPRALEKSLISRIVYRQTHIPKRISPEMVQRVIDRCDISTHVGVRDRAVVTIMAELGLRAIEIWRLRVQSFDWESATITIEGKGGRGSIVPITQGVGDAVINYILNARPESSYDALFLRSRRPYAPLSSAGCISEIASHALGRCEVRAGGHIVRHTLATELLRNGSGLDEVATILRHQDLDSTAIYAKVDDRMLSRLITPWPEQLV